MIEISEVTYHFDKKAIGALDNINLRINQGVIHAILGPSGSGKSTLLNLICGDLPLQKGEIKINSVKSISKLEQSDNVLNKTVQEFVFEVSHLSEEETIHQFRQLLDHFNLEYKQQRLLSDLSGGELRRVGLIRTLINSSKIVLMDEPFNGLDPLLIQEMKDLLFDWIKKNKITVVIATHHVHQSLEFADQITILKDGKIMQSGSPKELLEKPNNSYCAQYFGPTNIKAARYKNHLLYVHELDSEFKTKSKEIKNYDCLVNISPWNIEIQNKKAKYMGKITTIRNQGYMKFYEVNFKNTNWIVQTLRDDKKIGERIYFELKDEDIRILEDVKQEI